MSDDEVHSVPVESIHHAPHDGGLQDRRIEHPMNISLNSLTSSELRAIRTFTDALQACTVKYGGVTSALYASARRPKPGTVWKPPLKTGDNR